MVRKAAVIEAIERIFGALGLTPKDVQSVCMAILEQLEKESITLLKNGGIEKIQDIDRNVKLMLNIRKIMEAYTG